MSFPVNNGHIPVGYQQAGYQPQVVNREVRQVPGTVTVVTTTVQVVPAAVVAQRNRQLPGTRGNAPVAVVSRGSIPAHSGVATRSPQVTIGTSAVTGQTVIRRK